MPTATRSRWVPPVVWAAFIELLTSVPNPPQLGVTVPHADKVVHFLLYAVLGFLVVRALEQAPARAMTLALAIVICALWGALDEWHQLLIPGRSAAVQDWIADASGGGVGAIVRALRQRQFTTDPA